jgi:hypothetical protein
VHIVPDQMSEKLGSGMYFIRSHGQFGCQNATGQAAGCICWPKPQRSVTPVGSAAKRWRSDDKVVTTATDVSYVKAEIASAIWAN